MIMKLTVGRVTHTLVLPRREDRQITLVGWSMRFRARQVALVWYRPLSVEIRQAHHVECVPIYDVTMLASSAILLAGLSIIALAWWQKHRPSTCMRRAIV